MEGMYKEMDHQRMQFDQLYWPAEAIRYKIEVGAAFRGCKERKCTC